jgi:hypothetical protein
MACIPWLAFHVLHQERFTMATVAVTQDDRIEQAIDEALGHLPVEKLVRGRRVAVKPNDTWASEDDKTGVTQPDTLRAVLRYGRGCSASAPRPCGTCGKPAGSAWGRRTPTR